MTAIPPLFSVIQIAELRGQQAGAAQRDLASALFPASAYPPDEMSVATTRARLKSLVDGIEIELRQLVSASADGGQAWPVLLGGRLLDDPTLIGAAHGEASFDRLHRRAWTLRGLPGVPPLLGELASGQNQTLAEAALHLLTAEAEPSDIAPHRQLPADILHTLCWRTVAALEVAGAAPIGQLVDAGEGLLAGHDEGSTRASAALRLAHLIGDEDARLLDPTQSGIRLFVAALSRSTRLDMASLCQMAVEPDQSRICIALRAAGLSPQEVAQRAAWLLGDTIQPVITAASIEAIAPESARTLCLRWATASRAVPGAGA